MTALVVSPVVPPPLSARRADGDVVRRPLPVAALPSPLEVQPVVCGTSTVDCNGRISEAVVIPALGWHVGTRFDIRVTGGMVVVTACADAVFCVSRPGQIRLSAAVRRWCGLTGGDRVLLTADLDAGVLVVHPPAAVSALVADIHTAVWGGAG